MIYEVVKSIRNEEKLLLAAQILAKDHRGTCLNWNEVVFDRLHEPTFFRDESSGDYIAVVYGFPEWVFRGTMNRKYFLNDEILTRLDFVGGIECLFHDHN